VLGVVIVGLVVGIITVNMLNAESTDEEAAGATDRNCSVLKTVDEIEECIQEAFDDDGSLDNLVLNYQGAINENIKEQDFSLAVQLINDGANFLVSYGECDRSLRFLDEVDMDPLDDDSLATIYSNAIGVAKNCNNEDMVNTLTVEYLQLDLGGENV